MKLNIKKKNGQINKKNFKTKKKRKKNFKIQATFPSKEMQMQQ